MTRNRRDTAPSDQCPLLAFSVGWRIAIAVAFGVRADICRGVRNDAFDPFLHVGLLNCCCAKLFLSVIRRERPTFPLGWLRM